MHTLGKVFLGLVALLTIVAVVLTNGLLGSRGEWLKRVNERQQQVADQEAELRQKRFAVDAAQQDVNRQMSQWGRTWMTPANAGGVLDPNTATVQLGVGAGQDLTAGKLVYLFGQNQDGSSRFMGTFRVTGAEADRASAVLARPPMPGEVQRWQTDGAWRIRESIPISWRNLFSELQAQTAEAVQGVVGQNGLLETQRSLIQKSEEELQRRLAELEGNPNAQEGADQDVRDGLVVVLRQAETSRDTELKTLDGLRHQFDQKYRDLQSLIAEIHELHGQLPQGAAANRDGRPAPVAGLPSPDDAVR